ncbi:Alternative cytochrome c oxidase subunit 2 [bacterium HR30]|jgi:cytochrome c oxidase subunit 2|nr:Alternative cytochrome c oxidase subunit 2 [bacterium HR30]
MLSWLVPQASTSARDIDWLFALILVTVGFWFVVAQAALFTFIFRFRRRPGVAASYISGERKEEKRWISRPHALVIVCDVVLIVGALLTWKAVKQDLPPADERIRIVAQQWAWVFVHPGPDGKLDTEDDVRTVNDLRLKIDTTYHFELTSRDVVHSFSVPAFRLKQDAVPGRIVTGWFRPTRLGTYDIQCAEICGIGHALMPARLTIETPAEHAAWYASRSAQGG